MTRPGEVTLAHNGVLFLDEVGEFRRLTLTALQTAVRDGEVCLSRAVSDGSYRQPIKLPARPLFLAAANRCACGYYGDGTNRCHCSEERRNAWLCRIQESLGDLISMAVVMEPVRVSDVHQTNESSATVRGRVFMARKHAGAAPQTVARTIADLSAEQAILPEHETEAATFKFTPPYGPAW